MDRKYLELYGILGLLLVVVLALLIGRYYFGWFPSKSDNFLKYVPEKSINIGAEDVFPKSEITPQVEKAAKKTPAKNTPDVAGSSSVKKEIPDTVTHKNTEIKKIVPADGTQVVKVQENPVIATRVMKRFDFSGQNFHSLGEFVSPEEKNYRLELIDDLTISTIVIDRLSKGNGISQEFYKVAFKSNMIPSKVLKDIVESSEFRSLIPEKMLKKEGRTANDLKNGETVVFSGSAIENLLILWSAGKLTPVQKAWIVGVEK